VAGNDDVFYKNNVGSGWSEPQRVHPKNDVPDFQPLASINDDGNVVVQWKTFDFSAGEYVKAERLYKVGLNTKNRLKTDVQRVPEHTLSDIELPNFLPANSYILVHFADNERIQSFPLDPRIN